ncbi:MAG: hypothetical protein K0S53_1301 [Bacteroidetes bacterium]|jgi:opacity protein-like surface antigen|nr:hypothetical protein [Bacteroidota bacterium]MDF2452403.1 hypothetical protein [Bacteroidota bacterium]
MKLFICLLLCLTDAVFAQTADSLKTKKWAVGVTGSPDYCYQIPYTSKVSSGYTGTDTKANNGITAGFNVVYKVSKRIGIEIAVLYSTKGIVAHMPPWITPGGTYDPSIPNGGGSTMEPEKRTAYKYQYLEVPLKINCYILNRRFKVFPSLGVSANLFLGKKTATTVLDNAEIRKTTISHSYNSKNIPVVDAALLVGIGFSYDINRNVFIKLEPSYRQFLRPLVDAPVSGYLYSVGMNTGIYLRF